MECEVKKCQICGEVKASTEFYPKRFGDYDRRVRCKACIAAKSKYKSRSLATDEAKENWVNFMAKGE